MHFTLTHTFIFIHTYYYYYISTAVSSSSVVVLAGAVDYLLDLLSLAKLPPSNTEHFVTAKRTATKAVIGGYFLLRKEKLEDISQNLSELRHTSHRLSSLFILIGKQKWVLYDNTITNFD